MTSVYTDSVALTDLGHHGGRSHFFYNLTELEVALCRLVTLARELEIDD